MKKILLTFLFLSFFKIHFAQYVYELSSATNGTTYTTCKGIAYTEWLNYGSFGSPIYGYEQGIDRYYTFCSGGGQIKLNFTALSLNTGDYVRVYEGTGTGGTLLATWTNTVTTLGNSITSNSGGCLTIRLTTNSDNAIGEGFDALVGCPNVGCSGTPADDNCITATQICDASVYCGNTGGWYTADHEYIDAADGSSLFCGSIENNSWLQYTANSTSSSFRVVSANCTNSSSGVQMQLFSTSDCISLTSKSSCINQDTGPGTFTLSSNAPLTPGTNYYIMIDGYGGNNCGYTITPISGVQTVSLASTSSLCIGQTKSLNISGVTPGSTFSWAASSAGAITGVTNTATITASPTITTIYTVTVNQPNGCSVTSYTSSITVNSLPVMSSANTATICSGSTLNHTLSANISSNFSWIAANNGFTTGESLSAQSTATINNTIVNTSTLTQSVIYSVTPTSTSGSCAGATQTVNVTVNPAPVITSTTSPNTLCLNSSLSYTLSGANTYSIVSLGSVPSIGTITPPTAGTIIYTVNATSALGCTNTAAMSVTVVPNPTVSILSVSSNSICSGITSTITPSGASTYTLLNTGATGTSFTVNPSTTTTYSITGSTSSCLSNTVNTTITVTAPTITPVFTSTTICQGNNTTLTVTGNPASSMVSFANSTNYAIPDNIGSGVTSTISVSGLTGTVGVSLLSVNLDITHTYDADLDIYLVCPNGTTITLSDDNGSSGQNYTNTTFSTTGTAITAASGTAVAPFTGTFTPEQPFSTLNGCTTNGVWKLFIKDDANNDIGTLEGWSITFVNQNSYSWGPTTGLSPSTGTNVVASPTTTTVYTVTGTDATGCSSAKTITVNVNPLPTPTIASTNSLCLGSSFTFTGSGATTYTWSASAGGGLATSTGSNVTATPTITGNMTYTVNVTGANGCTNTASKTITVNPVPTANAGTGGTLTCNATTLSLSGSGTSGSTYSWTGPASGIVSGSTTATPVVSVQGTYSLAVTSTAGCTSTISTVAVSQNTTAPSVTATPSGSLNCTTTTVNITASTTPTSGLTYQWSGTGITGSTTNSVVSVTQSGTFNYTVTNTSNGCKTIGNQAIAQNTLAPSITAISTTQTITCIAPVVTLTATANPSTCTAVWFGGVTSSSSTVTGYTATVSSSNVYTLTVTNPFNNCSASQTVSVVPDLGFPNLNSPVISNSITCNTSTASIVVSSTSTPISYTWTGTGIVSGINSPTVILNNTTTHTLVVKNTSSGCTTSLTVSVPLNTVAPTPNATTNGILTCNTSSLTTTLNVTPTSGLTYTWTGPAGGIVSGTNSSSPTVSVSGIYSVAVTSTLNGCTNTATTSVSQNTAVPTPTASNTGTLTCSINTVTLNGLPASGVTYTWTGPSVTTGTNTQNAIAGALGTYTLKVTDAVNSCTNQAITTVDQNIIQPAVTASSPLILTCAPSNSTSALNGGPSSGVTYTWTGPSVLSDTNSQNAVAGAPGTYTLKVTDAINSCTNQAITTVTQNITPPSPTASASGSLTCINTVVTLTATPSSGVSYQWSGPGLTGSTTNATAQGTIAGVYSVQVTSTTNSCVASRTVEVLSDYFSPSATASNTQTLNCITTTVLVTGGPLSGVTYTWSGPGITTSVNNSTIVVNQPGSYDLVITNTVNGCQNSAHTDVIKDISTPTITVTSPSSITCSSPTSSLSSSPTTGVTYTWTGAGIVSGNNTATPIVNISGTYTVAMTNNSNGCSSNTTISVPVNTTAITPTITVPGILNCTTISESISALPTSGVTYTWTGTSITAGSNTSTITLNQPGTYSLSVTNLLNGCIRTETVNVIRDIAPPTVSVAPTTSINCTNTVAVIVLSTAASPVTYTWSGSGIVSANGTNSVTVNQSGTFNYTVINTANTCSTTGSQAIIQDITVPSVLGSNTGSLNCTVLNINASATTSTTPVSYNWSGAGIMAGSGTGTITANQGGTYNYTVTNTVNTCSTTGSQAITQNTIAPTTTASTTGSVTCKTNTISLLSSLPGMSYTWTAPAGSSVISGSSLQDAVGQELGTYTLTVLNPVNSCTFQTSVAAIQNVTAPSTVTAGPDKALVCVTPTLTLDGSASAGATANWLGGVASPNSFTTTTGAAGVYTLQAIEPTTGCFITSTVAVTQSTLQPVVTPIAVTSSITCINSVVEIGISVSCANSYSVDWTSGTGISGPTNYTFAVNNPSITTSATLTGVYQATVTDAVNGCIMITAITVTDNITPVTVVTTTASSITCLNTTETLNITPVGSNYTYTWTGSGITSGGSTTNPVVNIGGDYSVEVTNTINGCIGTGTINVPMDIVTPTVNIGTNSYTTTCANPNVAVSITSTPTANVTYSWTAPSSGALNTYTISNPSVSGYGIFTVVATNTINGCSSSLTQNTINVISDITIPTTTLTSITETITCSNPTPTVNIAVSTNSVSYSWMPTNGIVAGTETTATPQFSLVGTYSVIVTNTINGCVTNPNSNLVTIDINNTIPVVTLSTSVNSGTINCTNLFVSVTPTITPLSSDFTYTWSAGSGISTPVNQANATFTAAGIYTFAITNTVTGCVTSFTDPANTYTVIADNTPPTFTLGTGPSVNATCAMPNVDLSASSNADPNSVYTWTTPSSSNLIGNPITVSAPGIYTVAVTNTVNGCSSEAIGQNTVEVIADSGIPTVSLTADSLSITCLNSTPTITITTSVPTNSVSYVWTPTLGIVAGTETTASPSFTAPNSYSLVVQNTSSGCASDISTYIVDVVLNTTAPSVTLTSSGANDSTLTCLITSIVVTPTVVTIGSSATYTWTSSAGTFTNTLEATFTTPDVYTLTVMDAITGCTTSISDPTNIFTVIADNTPPTFTLGTGPSVNATCAMPNVDLSASSNADPNSVYTWTTPSSSNLIGNPITVSAPGIYTVAVTNTVNGCSSEAIGQNIVEVIADSGIPTVSLTADSLSITCLNSTPGTTITTSVPVGSISYSWSPSTGIVAGTETTATPSFSAAGNYSVVVTNTTSGCASDISSYIVDVFQNTTAPSVTLTSSGANDSTLTCLITSIVVTPTVITIGSSATYTWTSSAGTFTNTLEATFTTPDVYTLTVMDAITGCTTSISDPTNIFTVSQYTVPPTATITAISTNSTIGCGGSSSTVTLEGTSSSTITPIFNWLPGNISGSILPVTTAGIYTLVATDPINTCSTYTVITVIGSTTTPQGVDAGTTANIACGDATVTLIGTTTSTNISYSWSGPSATSITSASNIANPTVTEVGDYTLTVTDNSTGCQSTATVFVSQAIATASIAADPITGLSPLTVNFTGSGQGTLLYNWNFGDTNTSNVQNPSNTYSSGTFTVTLTTSSGTCIATATVLIVVEDGLTLEIPNVFTPNSDGSNDIFTIKSTGVKQIALQIFNRWGEKLYEFSGPKANWDGLTPNGAKVPEGTYFYFVKATGFDDKEIEKHGTVNLFR